MNYKTVCICQYPKLVEFKPYIKYKNETVFKEYEGLVIAQCEECGMLKTLSTKSINPEISNVELYEERKDDFTQYFEKLAYQIKKYKDKGTLLDVGAASGITLEVMKDAGFKVFGIEPNKKAFNLLKRKFGRDIYNGYLKDYLKINKQKFNVVIYNHVFEHLEDPVAELRFIKQILRKDGLLVIGIPIRDNVVFYLRQKYWESLLPNQHIWHFAQKDIARLLANQGFKIVDFTFTNHERKDYPFLKRLYFRLLTSLNSFLQTGEALTLIAKLK